MFEKKLRKLLVIKPLFSAWPPGFAYVLACLEANNIPFDFIDASSSQNWKKDMKIMLNNNNYFALATGGLIGFFRFFQEVSYIKHKCCPDVPLILGGNITKDAGNSLLFERIGMNFGILGEAETSLPGLINKILNGNDEIGNLPGIIYKNNNGDIVRNPPQRLDLKKDNIMPAWHNFDVDYYIKSCTSPFIGHNLNFMPILTGRGCVGKCTFCSPTIGGFRKRPMEHVIYEIEHITSKYNFDKIMFYNEVFYPTSREINDFCRQYKLLKNKKPWIAQVRVSANIDIDTLIQMKEAGCIVSSAGIESGSDRVLNLMNKRTTSEQIRIFFRNAKMANIPANGTFIVGNEGETEEDIKRTIDLVIEEEINTGESLMYVYPGTAAYDNALKKGLIKNEMDHLKKATKIYTGLFSPNVKENHLNISNIPDDQFLDIAIREVRRYNTFVFNRYPVQELSCKIEIKGREVIMVMDGKCHECGFDVRNTYNIINALEYIGFLGLGANDRYICPKCFKQLSFNIYSCKEMIELMKHLCFLKEQISQKNKIIICGINGDATFILRINLLDLDYKKIHGFIDVTKQYRDKYYVNYPVFRVKDIMNLNPDCILMVDSISDSERVIRRFYDKKNIPAPEFLYLCDNQLRNTLKQIKIEVGFGSHYNNVFVWLKNQYMHLIEFCDEKDIYLPEFLTGIALYYKKKFYPKRK